jgi:Arc/MetJ-type ribon-helix-helix transcriptional regulator
MTIELNLPPELEQYVAERASRENYPSMGAAIIACLREQKAEYTRKLEELRQLIAEGIAEADRGELEPFDDVMEILEEVRAEAKARDTGAA